jgi:hypothetical protein
MWDRIRIRPKAAAFPSCLALDVGEFARLVVPNASPGEAVADHFQVDEGFTEVNSSDTVELDTSSAQTFDRTPTTNIRIRSFT